MYCTICTCTVNKLTKLVSLSPTFETDQTNHLIGTNDTISFLGHIVEEGHIRADPAKIQVVLEWPTATSRKHLQLLASLSAAFKSGPTNNDTLGPTGLVLYSNPA